MIDLTALAGYRKAIVNVLGLATSLMTLGFLHGSALVIVNGAIAVLTAVLHVKIPNAAPAAPAPAPPAG